MARLARMNLPGQPQHVIIRWNNRTEIFSCEADYYFYLEKLQAAWKKHECHIHAYVLMTNHVHFLLTPFNENGLGKMMQMLGRYYVQHFNHFYRRTDTLWEGCYKATLVDSESYLLTCMRYIELNPVRAGMIKDPADYLWSSYRYNALSQTDNLVIPHAEFGRLELDNGDCHAAYKALFVEPLAPPRQNRCSDWIRMGVQDEPEYALYLSDYNTCILLRVKNINSVRVEQSPN